MNKAADRPSQRKLKDPVEVFKPEFSALISTMGYIGREPGEGEQKKHRM